MAQSAIAAKRAASLKIVQQQRATSPLIDLSISKTASQDYQSRGSQRDTRKRQRKLNDRLPSDTAEFEAPKADHSLKELPAPTLLDAERINDTERAVVIPDAEEPQIVTEDSIANSRAVFPALDLNIGTDYVWNDKYETVNISLNPGEVVLAVGEYEVWVRKGTVRIQGAIIHASSKAHRVLCPSSHAIFPIEALLNPYGPASQQIEICINSCTSGIRQLQRLDQRFLRIWPQHEGALVSFEILQPNDITPATRLLNFDNNWHVQAVKLLESDRPPVVLICGSKNTGKSTFSRFLSNSFLSKKYLETGLAYLDLDPGQPEYSCPADVSLVHVKSFNLSPPFAHPMLPGGLHGDIVRQHHYGHFSPRENLDSYLKCVTDLYHCYSVTMMQSKCPLIVNTCGWTQGTGIELLESLAALLRPSHVAVVTSPDFDETSASLQNLEAEILIIPTLVTPLASNSGADLRSMQHCSYFHIEDTQNGQLYWKSDPTFTSKSLKLSYAGDNKVISAVLLLGDHIDYDMLEDAIDKTILALVAVEDSSLFSDAPDTHSDEEDHAELDSDNDTTDLDGSPATYLAEHGLSEGSDFAAVEDSPYILRTNSKGLPYLSTMGNVNPPLEPTRTRSIGQVLVSGINLDQKIIEMHTPISSTVISECLDNGMTLLLVRGQLGMPEWAYLEEFNLNKAMQEDAVLLKRLGQAGPSDDAFGFDITALAQQTPYLELLDSKVSKGRGKVRRLRRNFVGK